MTEDEAGSAGSAGSDVARVAGAPSRAIHWGATMAGNPHRSLPDVVVAHPGAVAVGPARTLDRRAREEFEDRVLAAGATRARGAGNRGRPEPADPERTCFERDRDRIVHSAAFRRLAGKTQVFVFPPDHVRTRLTHALEVAQVATAVARAAGLNVALTEAIALGHDCGHGPGGHASEEALEEFVPGFSHARWGADVTLRPLNLCAETLDGVRRHSWTEPAPATPEGEVVSWADRIAYCAHDFEDAVHAGIVVPRDLPNEVAEVAGRTRSRQLDTFVSALLATIRADGVVGMGSAAAAALAALRRFNYERVYLRPESVAQNTAVVTMLRALVEFAAAHPHLLPPPTRPRAAGGGTPAADRDPADDADPLFRAVAYVAGMTDRYACRLAEQWLGWPPERLPIGIDIGGGAVGRLQPSGP